MTPLFSFDAMSKTFSSVIKDLEIQPEADCKSLHPGSIPGEASKSNLTGAPIGAATKSERRANG
jgi:hypothetical protein